MRIALILIVATLGLFGGLWPRQIEARATSLWTDQVCAGDGTVHVNLHWGPVDYTVYDQWLDLAWLDDYGHAKQLTSGTFSGRVSSLNWPGLQPASTYYVRVTQRSINDVVSLSTVFVIKTASCSSTVPGEIVSVPNTGDSVASSSTGGSSSSGNPNSESTRPKDEGDTNDSDNPADSNEESQGSQPASSSQLRN